MLFSIILPQNAKNAVLAMRARRNFGATAMVMASKRMLEDFERDPDLILHTNEKMGNAFVRHNITPLVSPIHGACKWSMKGSKTETTS